MLLFGFDISSTLPTTFFNEVDIGDDHRPVDGLAHVIDGNRSGGDGNESIDLHTCFALGLDPGFDLNGGFVRGEG